MSIIQRYGLISGLMWANFPFILHYSGAGDNKNYFLLPILALYILFLYMGIRQRKNELKGYLDQRDGIRIGLGISLISGLMLGIAIFILYKYVSREWMTALEEAVRKDAPAKYPDLSPEELDEQIGTMLGRYPWTLAFINSSIIILLGGIFSVIISLLMRSSKTRE